MIETAVKGTLNVLKACCEVKVKRLIVVSSIAAVIMNPGWPKSQVIDEACWSDADYCRKTEVTDFVTTHFRQREQIFLSFPEFEIWEKVIICNYCLFPRTGTSRQKPRRNSWPLTMRKKVDLML